MHARVTRYEGAAPNAIEEALQAKKGVLPTEFGQTEGMQGAVFLIDREKERLWSSPSGTTRTRCGRARTMRLGFARRSLDPVKPRRWSITRSR